MKHLALLTAVALSLPTMIHAQVITAGELVVDLRAADLNSSSTTWMNLSTSADTVGNLSTIGGGYLNVGTIAGQVGLNVNNSGANAVISSLTVPTLLQGDSTRSVEAWLYVSALTTSGKSPVSWGDTSRLPSDGKSMSQFRYSNGAANGLFTGWYGNDVGWTTGSVLASEWVYVAWVYDGAVMKGYVNGNLTTTANINIDLATPATRIRVGAGRDAGSDAFNGYLADVRVQTGVLSDSDVLNNFNQGIYPVPEPSTFALLGLGSLALIFVRRRA
jgi:hypothetical protein